MSVDEGMAVAEPFQISITEGAEADLAWFKAHDRRIIMEGLDIYLKNEPTAGTRRLKALRPNPVADWELRLGDFRVLYDVDEAQRIVIVQVVGEKRGNRLLVQGQEFQSHESDQP